MRRWLSQRLGWGATGRVGSDVPDPVAMARALGLLYVAGATVATLTLVLPHEPTLDLALSIVLVLASFGGAVVVLTLFDRMPPLGFDIAVAAGTTFITLGIYATGNDTSAFAFFYLWAGLYSAYFLPRPRAAIQALLICAGYLWVLDAQDPPGVEIDRYLITTGTVLVSMALVSLLATRLRELFVTLSDAAKTDPLTGLVNRRGFEDVFEAELERSHRTGHPFAVVIADLDGFKSVNDHHGHLAGDEMLRRMGQILRRHVRIIDTAARHGGEEFALIVPESDEKGGYTVAERIRRAVGAGFASDPIPLTISLGVASYPAHGGTTDALVSAADQALYTAKRLGKNRTVIFNPDAAATLDLIDGADDATGRQLGVLLTLAEVLDLRDSRTANHSHAVGEYAALAGRALGLDPPRVERIRLAGVLHDIGKIGIADAILQKDGPLTDDEWDEMRRHPEIGARLLSGPGVRRHPRLDPRPSRASRRSGLSARAHAAADPPRSSDPGGRGRVRGDDRRPDLPAGDRPDRRGDRARARRGVSVRPPGRDGLPP